MEGKNRWYISYKVAHGCVMEIAKNEAEAIDAACGMLDRGIDIQEVGPMIEPPEGKLIGPAEIRRIQRTRLAAWSRLSAEKAGSPNIWERRLQAAEDLEKEVSLAD
jgi:hypothetical protein